MLTFDEYLQDNLNDEEFAVGYEEAKAELDFGLKLAQRREMLGLTQTQLAKLTGIKQPMIARIERGQMPKPFTLQKLAKALKAQIVFTSDMMFISPIRSRKNDAVNKDQTVSSAPNPVFKEEIESEIPITNVVNFDSFKKKRDPLTIRNIEKQEDYHEDIGFAIG
jgi:transcriptional regulator with XRE-family HTH domain